MRWRSLCGWTVVLLASLSAGFGAGFAVSEREMFPYYRVRPAWDRLERLLFAEEAPPPGTSVVPTNLLRLRMQAFPWTLDARPQRRGGGAITTLGDSVIGVDKHGVFFLYESPGVFRRLPLRVESNLGDLIRQEGEANAFRFLDIAARRQGTRTEIFVSHHFWDPERQCKTTRVSRLATDDIAAILAPRDGNASLGEWQTLFESRPCIAFSDRYESPFQRNTNGGRLVLAGADRLFLSLGDHGFNGVDDTAVAPQEAGVSYGKIILIDPRTKASEIYAYGMRNPQGLLLDSGGNLWQTEHGPKGGDELNLILPGRNYGWPLTTFGTNYDRYEWPLNPLQGRHQGPDAGFTVPVYSWVPSIGVSNLIQIGAQPERWAGDLLVASLTGHALHRLRVQEGRALFSEPISVGARIRDLVQMSDGTILLWTDDRALIELKAREKQR